MKKMMGFTLIELIITVAIIGILASVYVPSYKKYKESQPNIESQSDNNIVSSSDD